MTVTQSYNQLDATIRDLDLHSRIYLGQYDEMLYRSMGRIFSCATNRNLHDTLCKLRNVFIPSMEGYSMNSSLGIWGDYTPITAIRSYDIQQCLRYQLAYHRNSGREGSTVNFRVPYIHGKWEMSPDDVNRNHLILEGHGIYPDFRKGYEARYTWKCPCIITGFEPDVVSIEWSRGVQEIIDAAEKTAELVGENRITEVFRLLYPDVDLDAYKPFTELIEQTI